LSKYQIKNDLAYDSSNIVSLIHDSKQGSCVT